MVIVAIAVLGGMSWLPEIDFSGFKLRKVDLLSQLHYDANSYVEEVEPEAEEVEPDKNPEEAPAEEEKPKKKDKKDKKKEDK